MTNVPKEIVGPITNSILPPKTSDREAFENVVAKIGRRHVVISGVTIGTCCAMPTFSMPQDGQKVFPVVDACGAWNRYEAEAATLRMAHAGAELVTTFALACELQADWKLPSANDMLAPFVQNLPEYGLFLQNFWNNANRHVVPDSSRGGFGTRGDLGQPRPGGDRTRTWSG